MRRILAFLLLLAPLALAEKAVAEFRLEKDPRAVLRGWILDYDDDGSTGTTSSRRIAASCAARSSST